MGSDDLVIQSSSWNVHLVVTTWDVHWVCEINRILPIYLLGLGVIHSTTGFESWLTILKEGDVFGVSTSKAWLCAAMARLSAWQCEVRLKFVLNLGVEEFFLVSVMWVFPKIMVPPNHPF